jgi:hypothetical protein
LSWSENDGFKNTTMWSFDKIFGLTISSILPFVVGNHPQQPINVTASLHNPTCFPLQGAGTTHIAGFHLHLEKG